MQKGLQISPKSNTLIFFSKTTLTIFLVFGLKLVWNSIWMKSICQKKLELGDIWPQTRLKIAQIEVFGHFLDFAPLVFLDFANTDRRAWCLVVFLQFSGPVNVFLFFNELILFLVFTPTKIVRIASAALFMVIHFRDTIFTTFYFKTFIFCSAVKAYIFDFWYLLLNFLQTITFYINSFVKIHMSSIMSTHCSYIKNRYLNKSKIDERSVSVHLEYLSVSQTLVRERYRFASFKNFEFDRLICNSCPKYLLCTNPKETLKCEWNSLLARL